MASSSGTGLLRTYLGTAPGVGKTYAMLAEGRHRAENGTPDEHHCPVRRDGHSCGLMGKTASRRQEHVPPDPCSGLDAGLDGTEDQAAKN